MTISVGRKLQQGSVLSQLRGRGWCSSVTSSASSPYSRLVRPLALSLGADGRWCGHAGTDYFGKFVYGGDSGAPKHSDARDTYNDGIKAGKALLRCCKYDAPDGIPEEALGDNQDKTHSPHRLHLHTLVFGLYSYLCVQATWRWRVRREFQCFVTSAFHL